jgi:hypothetical protein
MGASRRPRIVSASYRSDIPAFYGDWFLRRLEAGWAAFRNPYGGQIHRVSLRPADVDGFVFWTRNPQPFLPALDAVAALDRPFVVQLTVTGYPRPLEPAVVAPTRAIAAVRQVVARFGAGSVVWRYDPVFLTSLTPPAWHRESFARLADALAGTVDEVVLSFAQIYAKTARNSERAAERHGFDWYDPAEAEKRALLGELAALAGERGLSASLCSQPDLLGPGLEPARCIDAARLSRLAGRPITAAVKGNRPGCLCAESRDIGAYDSCPQGCVYCYAVGDPARANRRFKAHDPAGERLDQASD